MRKEEEKESEKNAVQAAESRVPGSIDLRYSKVCMNSKSSVYWLFWNPMLLCLEIITYPKVYAIF